MKKSQIPLFVILGFLYWFAGAMMVKFLGELVFTEDNPLSLFMFILAIPITYLAIYLSMLASKLSLSQMLEPLVIMTSSAIFLDGIALTWFQWIYHESVEIALHGAAWILWAGGIGLLLTFLHSKNRKELAN
ncbi:MAG: DUF5367 family protein [Bacteroidia bacterium]|nr:DUF5367 family protein [Bacteroidia bacterium]